MKTSSPSSKDVSSDCNGNEDEIRVRSDGTAGDTNTTGDGMNNNGSVPKAEDAEKLISSGKAIVIDDEGNPVEDNAEDSGDTTESDNTADPNADVIDETVAAEATDDGIALDDKNVEEPNIIGLEKGVSFLMLRK